MGLYEFRDLHAKPTVPKVLDLGCGIGRHVLFSFQMGVEGYGVDLSHQAVEFARRWLAREGCERVNEKVLEGDIQKLPWPDHFFDFVVSHGVLDSMNFDIARNAVGEVARVLSKEGLFYCDLVSGDDSVHAREFSGEELVKESHEFGTVQSYFNFTKINRLVEGCFELVDAFLVKRENVIAGACTSRYHLVLRPIC